MYRRIENLQAVLENHLIYLETGDLAKCADLSSVDLIDTDLNCAEGLNGNK